MAAALPVRPASISSAEPEQLLAFAAHSGELSQMLRSNALAAGEAVARFRASGSPPPPGGDPTVDLLELLNRWFHLDDWVRHTGVKYLRADGTIAIPLGDGVVLSIPLALVAQLVNRAQHLSLGRLGTIGRALFHGGSWVWHHTGGLRKLLGNAWHCIGPLVALAEQPGPAASGLLPSAAGLVAKIPGGATVAEHVPLAGGALGLATTANDCVAVAQQGNPTDAWHRRGTGYAADVDQCAFDISSLAAMRWPNPVTVGLTTGLGVGWGLLSAIHSRSELVGAAERIAGSFPTHVVGPPGLLPQPLADIATTGVNLARSGAQAVVDALNPFS